MMKRFNYTGACTPEKHYMVDLSAKTAQIFRMIEEGDYFVINSPRQYGKTTTIHMLNRFLKGHDQYHPIKMSFEGIGVDGYKNEAVFIEAFLSRLKRALPLNGDTGLGQFIDTAHRVDRIDKLDLWITQLVEKIGKKTVLIIDEVDKSCNTQLFLDFLGMLRDKYLNRNDGEEQTFHSVILSGVHDIKSLKVKIRSQVETRYNSPWNIAADFNVDLSLSAAEITSMLKEYGAEQKVKSEK